MKKESYPPITLGMPVYNGARYIDKTLSALTAQSFRDFILLISDNASTDETPGILVKWAARDPRIVVVRQPENIGIVKNFRYVLEEAKSPWFMYVAHDDFWSPNYLEALYAVASGAPGIKCVIPRVIHTYSDGRTDKVAPAPKAAAGTVFRPAIPDLLRHAQGSWFYGLFCRQAMLEVEEVMHRYRYLWAHDMVVLTHFILSGRMAAADDAVFYHLETGLTTKLYKPKNFRDRYGNYRAFLQEVFRALKTAPLSPSQKLMLIPTLLGYTGRHSSRLRRILRSAVLFEKGDSVLS